MGKNDKDYFNSNQQTKSKSDSYMSARKKEYTIIAVSIVAVVLVVVIVACVFGMKTNTKPQTIRLLDDGKLFKEYSYSDENEVRPNKKQGYTFCGWIDEKGVIYETAKEAIEAGNTEVRSYWEPTEIKVKLYTYGGVIEGDDTYVLQQPDEKGEYYLKTITVETEEFLLPAIVGAKENNAVVKKDNYAFVQWSKVPGSRDMSARQAKIEKGQVNDCEYYAIWDEMNYSITFDTQGGTNIPAATGLKGDKIEIPEDPERVGYTFNGWDKEIPEVMPAYSMIIRAQWTPNKYKVSYDLNYEGATTLTSQDLDYGSEYTFPAEDKIKRTGYSFEGWYLEKECENKIGEKIETASNHTLYAKWTINKYTITFDRNDGSEVAEITLDYGLTVPTIANPERVGYTFTSWDKTIPATMPAEDMTIIANWTINQYTITFINSNDNSIYGTITQDYGTDIAPPAAPEKYGCDFAGWSPAIPATMPAENLEIVINWEIVAYRIIFETGDENVIVEDIIAEAGDAITKPADPEREGYTFAGWDKTIPATMPAENMTITAQWTINQYTITFNSNGGSDVASITLDYGSEIVAPTAPTKKGYTFNGWNPAIPETMPAEDMTVIAQWTACSYNITYDLNYDGATLLEPIASTYDSTYNFPATEQVTRTGYTFEGWYLEEECENKIGEKIETARDHILYAKWEINQYTITFDRNDGSEVAEITLDYGLTVPAIVDPERVGYEFAGWSPAIPATMPAEDMTITAKWKINQYTITFDSAGGSDVAEIKLDYGATIEAPADPTKEGYTFAGWSPAIPETMPVNGIEVVAQWTINQYTITIDSNDGSEVATITLDYGLTVPEIASPERVGYTFTGWSPAIPAKMPAEDMTITAQWTINQYTIRFNSDGGSDVAEIKLDYGSEIVAPADPTKEGYTFNGWSPAIPATMPAEEITITAQWTINQYTITFNSDGGSDVASITLDYGTVIEAPTAPTKEGYTFNGWSPAIPATMPAEEITITAQWTINQYTITFNSEGGSDVASITLDYDATIETPTAPTKEGYTFAGWSPVIPAKMPAENKTVIAQWTPNKYTITFKSNGGSEVAAITLDYGATIETPTAPTKEGYTFAGWSPAIPETMPVNGIEVVAQWTINKYTITFDSAGGTAIDSITLDYGTAIEAPTAPTKEGYTFAGWSPEIPATMPVNGIEVVAQWTPIKYNVSYDLNYDGATTLEPIASTYDSTYNFPAAEQVTRTGYTFEGWYLENTCTNKVTSETVVAIADNHTLYAKWEAIKYNITYVNVTPFEIIIEASQYTIEEVPQLKVPTDTEVYTFDAWYTDEALTTLATGYTQGMHEDITVYGNWYSTGLVFDTETGAVSLPLDNVEYQEMYYIPKVYQGVRITTIAMESFNGVEVVKKIDMRYIQTIENHAFANSTIETIVISKELSTVERYAFSGINALTLEIVTKKEEFNKENIAVDTIRNGNLAFVNATEVYIN